MNLWEKKIIIPLLQKHNLWAKKNFGQNFLINKGILDKIIQTADIHPEDNIIEVGPGLGVLTQELCKTGASVTSIELDRNLLPLLNETVAHYPNLQIIQGDALKTDPPSTKYKVVANIPYNISSPLLNHFLQATNKPTCMTVLIQKEVATKICETDIKSILNLQVKLFAESKITKTVKPGSFYPAPKVDSAILHLTINPKVPDQDAQKILKIAKVAFSKKRKKILRTLEKGLEIDLDKLKEIFQKLKINENTRPQELIIPQWQELAQNLLP